MDVYHRFWSGKRRALDMSFGPFGIGIVSGGKPTSLPIFGARKKMDVRLLHANCRRYTELTAMFLYR